MAFPTCTSAALLNLGLIGKTDERVTLDYALCPSPFKEKYNIGNVDKNDWTSMLEIFEQPTRKGVC